MSIQIQGNSGIVQEVAGSTFRAANTNIKPVEYGALGHYRSAVRFNMAVSQTANTRVWEIRNTGSNIIIPTRLRIQFALGTITTAYQAEFDLFRATSFSAVDTTNTVTPTVSPKRSTMAAAPGGAAIRYVTAAGAAAGMTGGGLTQDGGPAGKIIFWGATNAVITGVELLDDVNGTCPFVLANNEGLVFNNVTGGSATANGVSVMVDFSWAEVTAY